MKKWSWFLLCITILYLSACSAPLASAPPSPTVRQLAPAAARQLPALPAMFPKIDRRPQPETFNRGALASIPTYNPNSDDGWQVDLRNYDLSGLDLRPSSNDLMYADFDSQTTWPPAERMPPDFDWKRMMELGKNPGLDMRVLHAHGINGQGVGIAIIDQPLLVDHQEYAERLQLYEEINIKAPGDRAAMHGAAVASIAVGKTIGVAPQADLYYIGSWTGDWGVGPQGFEWNFQYYAQAVRRVLKINEQLPEGRKIRVIAMQVGWMPDKKGYDDITAAVNEAKSDGLFVVSSSIEETYSFQLLGLGRAPLNDPDQSESYEPGMFWARSFFNGPRLTSCLLVPMDSRTTASPTGAGEYVFYRQGGLSWAIPYVAGMYALAAQVNPSITPDQFWSQALKTGRTIQVKHNGRQVSLGTILDPAALVTTLANQK